MWFASAFCLTDGGGFIVASQKPHMAQAFQRAGLTVPQGPYSTYASVRKYASVRTYTSVRTYASVRHSSGKCSDVDLQREPLRRRDPAGCAGAILSKAVRGSECGVYIPDRAVQGTPSLEGKIAVWVQSSVLTRAGFLEEGTLCPARGALCQQEGER